MITQLSGDVKKNIVYSDEGKFQPEYPKILD